MLTFKWRIIVIKIRKMNDDEREEIEKELKWSNKWNLTFNGFPFSWSLINDQGASFIIYVPPEISQEELTKAKNQCVYKQDMLFFMAIEVPANMLLHPKPKKS